jgi:trehalose synthase
MREVPVAPVALERLAGQLEPARVDRLTAQAQLARPLLQDRVVWNVNATASGGGVAEMLQTLLAYGRGAGVDTRWLVLDGTPEFFTVTKRLHNMLHGSAGDGGRLGADEKATYERVLAGNAESLRQVVGAGDIVLLHDPQTAGLVQPLLDGGAHVVWRCHIGSDTGNELTERGWEFLRGYVEPAPATVFSREAYAPDWTRTGRVWVIPPSLDPFSAKNVDLTDSQVTATLSRAGLVRAADGLGDLGFVRRAGEPGVVRRHDDLYVAGDSLPADARVVLQVSRWDHLKDMAGVLAGFADHLEALPDDAHLVLAGPEVSGVSDDPEGAVVLAECLEAWRALPRAAQARTHLCCLPMDDVDENAHLVNAMQRHAAVVVQKSLVEGFGLTVTEPMWKARPVVASRVGGIQDQVVHGESGLLLDDPNDLGAFAELLGSLLANPTEADQLGTAARERVRDRFLGDRHLVQYVELFGWLLGSA